MDESLGRYSPIALGLLRIALGLVMLNFGLAKIFHFHAGDFTPPMGSLPWIAGVIEMICGALFLIGWQTRLMAFLLAGEMAFAYFIAHFPQSVFPTENGGYAAAVFCFVFLYFVTAGPGKWAVDRA